MTYLDRARSELSDNALLRYFKIIRSQVKYLNRNDDALIKYINELEYRNIKYRI